MESADREHMRTTDRSTALSPVWDCSAVAQSQAHLVHVRQLFGRMIVELTASMSTWMSFNPLR
jgi:hypothetical protein